MQENFKNEQKLTYISMKANYQVCGVNSTLVINFGL